VIPHAQQADAWVERSNENSKVLLDLMARFNPEAAGYWGLEGFDEEIFQLPPDINEQTVRAVEDALEVLRSRLGEEAHPAVRQDLEILVHAGEQYIKGVRLNEKYNLPYFDVPQSIFQGVRTLLDDQVPEERRAAALVRLKRYTGLENGYTPITEQAMAFTKAKFGKELRGPFKGDVEDDLASSVHFVDGIRQLFEKYEIAGYEEPYDKLKEQLGKYEQFVRDEVLPLARDDFRQPEELYQFVLENVGIDMSVDELVSRAKVSFREIQNEMQCLAVLIAQKRGLESSDYRDVVRELKKEQLVGEEILSHYQSRIKDIESLIEKNGVVTLPQREMRIRLASEAESAAIPAPTMRPPRMIGNTGEMGEFVLPLRVPGGEGEEDVKIDDFTFEAASWTLTVHEGRPGHELQFASMVEKGVSQARVLFAFNSVNVEGWALYCEAEMKPYLPLDGQLISLQHRLLRAARAFLDPGLQLGDIDRDEALRILEQDVVLSHIKAIGEVERYTFRDPGQATSYYCGYTRLMELRTDTERLLGDRFDRRAYHDFVLSQGLLSPELLRKAVTTDFVSRQ
jgi:hypothetical protein